MKVQVGSHFEREKRVRVHSTSVWAVARSADEYGMSENPRQGLLQLIVDILAGWVNRRQQAVIAYLNAENRVLREQLGERRLRLTERQRRRLAVWGKELDRKAIAEVAFIVTPDTILRWYRRLVARRYDGASGRRLGRLRETGRDRGSRSAHGKGEPEMGLHAHPGWTVPTGNRHRQEHGQEDPARAWARARAGAWQDQQLGALPGPTPGRDRRRGLLHRGGHDTPRPWCGTGCWW